VLQHPVFGGRHHLLDGADRRQRALAQSRRQVNSWFGAISWCRATTDTDVPSA